MTNDYQNRLQGGAGYVPDFISDNYASDVSYIVGAGILYANEFQPSSGMVEGKDYTVFGPAEAPVYNVYATKDQVGRVLQALFGSDYGVRGSGYMTRLELANVYCAVQGRDMDPDYSAAALAGMKIAVFSDCVNISVVYEVSNAHDYMIDSYGHETWVYNERLLD